MNGLEDGDDELIRTFIKLTMNSKHKAYLTAQSRPLCIIAVVSYMIIEIYCSDQRYFKCCRCFSQNRVV